MECFKSLRFRIKISKYKLGKFLYAEKVVFVSWSPHQGSPRLPTAPQGSPADGPTRSLAAVSSCRAPGGTGWSPPALRGAGWTPSRCRPGCSSLPPRQSAPCQECLGLRQCTEGGREGGRGGREGREGGEGGREGREGGREGGEGGMLI